MERRASQMQHIDSKAWQRRGALLQSRAGLTERAEVIFLLRAGGSGEEI